MSFKMNTRADCYSNKRNGTKLGKKDSHQKIEAGSQRHLWTAAGTKCRIPPKMKKLNIMIIYETKGVIQRKLYKIKKF